MKQYMKVLKSYKRMTPEQERYLNENIHPITFRKNEFIQKDGEICDHIYFIEKGLVRMYWQLENKQKTRWVKKENNFIIALWRLTLEKPPYIAVIEALEDTILWAFPVQQIDFMSRNFPEFADQLGAILIKEIARQEDETRISHEHAAAARYDHIRKNTPDLLTRVPAKHLASLIGISVAAFKHMHQSEINLNMSSVRRVRRKSS